jgi:hypothetical protein
MVLAGDPRISAKEKRFWLAISAEDGFGPGIETLGTALRGDDSDPMNLVRARYWLNKALLLGKARMCSEGPPDVAQTMISNLTGSLEASLKNGQAGSAAAQFADSIATKNERFGIAHATIQIELGDGTSCETMCA